MRLLLDTHAYLWWLGNDPRLWEPARRAMADPSSVVFVSAASIWEIAIKIQIGKLEFDGDPLEEIEASGFLELPMTARHSFAAGSLPRHHDDPFDRMLLAQAHLEGLTLVSRDRAFRDYEEVALLGPKTPGGGG